MNGDLLPENNSQEPYYCEICKKKHFRGDIYKQHFKFARKFAFETSIQNIHDSIQRNFKFESEEIKIPKGILEIKDFSRLEIINRIDAIYHLIYEQISNNQLPSINVPLRRRENIIYNEDKQLFLGLQTKTIEFGDEYFEFLKILRIADIVKELLINNFHATKREVFYNDVALFKEQKYSDRAIEDLTTLLTTFRDNLHIVAAPKGTCVGRLKIRHRNEIIDLTTLGSGGWTISPLLDNIDIIESDAEFILVLEKDAAMMRLAEYRFWRKIPCILLTAQGTPNVAARTFLKILVSELKLPAIGLADSDPYGLSILMTYAYGSVQSAHETAKLGINNFYWLGVLPEDIEKYQIPREVQLKMVKSDLQRAHYMLKEPPIVQHKKLKEQLELMVATKIKAEIQAFAARGFDFLTKYIIHKLGTGDLIKF